jgi:hypothetical protein
VEYQKSLQSAFDAHFKKVHVREEGARGSPGETTEQV